MIRGEKREEVVVGRGDEGTWEGEKLMGSNK